MRRLLKLFSKNDIKPLLLGTFLSFCGAIAVGFLPYLLMLLTNEFQKDAQSNEPIPISGEIGKYLGLMIFAGICSFILCAIGKKILCVVAMNVVASYRMKTFKKIQEISIQDINKINNNSLISRLSNDTYNVLNTMIWVIIVSIPSLCHLTVFITFSLILNVYLSLLYLVIIPFLFCLVILRCKKVIPKYKQNLYNVDKVNLVMQENIVGIRTVKALNLQKKQFSRFNILNKEIRDIGSNADKKTLTLIPIVLSLLNIATILILVYSGLLTRYNIQIDGKELEIGTIVGFINYLFLSVWSIFEICLTSVYILRSNESIIRINKVLEIKNSITDIKNPNDFINGDIEFKHVSFKYNKKSTFNTLEDLSFTIKSGKTLGIIGQTGSGKTSLTNLISRIYDIEDGEILINGENIKNIKGSSLKKNIRYAFQEKMLFGGTIFFNIQFGSKNAGFEEVDRAAHLAEAYEFISKKEKKYEFEVSQRGANLSGGQKQRLSIARAIVDNPKILILDDTTSALDNITESKVLKNIRHNSKDITIILVAQRISTIQKCDHIIVMNDGTLAAQGNHDQLMQTSQLYQEIYASQTKEKEEVL